MEKERYEKAERVCIYFMDEREERGIKWMMERMERVRFVG